MGRKFHKSVNITIYSSWWSLLASNLLLSLWVWWQRGQPLPVAPSEHGGSPWWVGQEGWGVPSCGIATLALNYELFSGLQLCCLPFELRPLLCLQFCPLPSHGSSLSVEDSLCSALLPTQISPLTLAFSVLYYSYRRTSPPGESFGQAADLLHDDLESTRVLSFCRKEYFIFLIMNLANQVQLKRKILIIPWCLVTSDLY